MSVLRLVGVLGLVALAACEAPLLSPEQAALVCEERAREAQAPTGSVTVGANSRTGGFGGVSIGVTSDYLMGRDPVQVYEDCVMARSGQAPIRGPLLR